MTSVYATQLNEDGFLVLPILMSDEIIQYKQEYEKTLQNLPEFKHTTEVTTESQYSKTGFGTLGVASSYHNPMVRRLRLLLYQRLLPIFEEFDSICQRAILAKAGKINGSCIRSKVPRKFHEVIDCMLVRVNGQAPGKETWHQDMSFAVNEDTIFGGWLAFDEQRFSVIKGSHTNDICNKAGGFTPIKKGNPLYDKCEREREIRHIPPGSILIMNQIIVHEVLPSKTKDRMLRLFTGWRLTLDNTDLLCKNMKNRNSRQDSHGLPQNISEVLQKQMIPKKPSNQLPSLYNMRSVDYPMQQASLNTWIQKYIKDEYVFMNNEMRLFKNTTNVKYQYGLPLIHMPSLQAIDRKYEEYQPIEEFILTPQSFTDIKEATLDIIDRINSIAFT
jgi:hypothetical protein